MKKFDVYQEDGKFISHLEVRDDKQIIEGMRIQGWIIGTSWKAKRLSDSEVQIYPFVQENKVAFKLIETSTFECDDCQHDFPYAQRHTNMSKYQYCPDCAKSYGAIPGH